MFDDLEDQMANLDGDPVERAAAHTRRVTDWLRTVLTPRRLKLAALAVAGAAAVSVATAVAVLNVTESPDTFAAQDADEPFPAATVVEAFSVRVAGSFPDVYCDEPAEDCFDDIVTLAAAACGTAASFEAGLLTRQQRIQSAETVVETALAWPQFETLASLASSATIADAVAVAATRYGCPN